MYFIYLWYFILLICKHLGFFFFGRTLDGINYQTLSPKDLAKSVMSLGGWSEYLVNKSNPVVCILFFFHSSSYTVSCIRNG